MRITALTLLILVAGSTDGAALLYVLALVPLAGALMFLGFLVRPARRPRRRKVQRDDRNWRGVHRSASPPGRHAPARGTRLKGLSRQAQLEERTMEVSTAWAMREDTEAWVPPIAHEHEPYRDGVRIRCRLCLMDVEQPERLGEIGASGTQTGA